MAILIIVKDILLDKNADLPKSLRKRDFECLFSPPRGWGRSKNKMSSSLSQGTITILIY